MCYWSIWKVSRTEIIDIEIVLQHRVRNGLFLAIYTRNLDLCWTSNRRGESRLPWLWKQAPVPVWEAEVLCSADILAPESINVGIGDVLNLIAQELLLLQSMNVGGQGLRRNLAQDSSLLSRLERSYLKETEVWTVPWKKKNGRVSAVSTLLTMDTSDTVPSLVREAMNACRGG